MPPVSTHSRVSAYGPNPESSSSSSNQEPRKLSLTCSGRYDSGPCSTRPHRGSWLKRGSGSTHFIFASCRPNGAGTPITYTGIAQRRHIRIVSSDLLTSLPASSVNTTIITLRSGLGLSPDVYRKLAYR